MKDKYFLYVGNAYPHKNVETLMRAAKIAGERVVYVGKQDYFYRQLGVTPVALTDQKLKELYKNATALVFPSFMEGFGLPAIEALRQGCPVIVSDIPVFHELLGNIPVYFDPHSVDSLVEKLKHPPQKPKNTDMLLARFSWKKMAEETLAIYEACYSI